MQLNATVNDNAQERKGSSHSGKLSSLACLHLHCALTLHVQLLGPFDAGPNRVHCCCCFACYCGLRLLHCVVLHACHAARLDACYHPYHNALQQLAARIQPKLCVSIHS